MLAMSFFSWWYSQGWMHIAKNLKLQVQGTLEAFSVSQLMRTLFSPWRRIISYPGASLADRFHAWGDNVFSRFMGFIVRIFVLVAAFISVIIIGLLSVVAVIIWPLLPVAIPVLIVVGLA